MEARLPRYSDSHTLALARIHTRGRRRRLGVHGCTRARVRADGARARARDVAGEREIRHAGCSGEHRGLGRDGRVGLGAGALGVQHVVDHVDDAVSDQDVGLQQLGAVDVDIVPRVQHREVLALGGDELGAVRQAGRVDDLREHVIVHDLTDLIRGHGGDRWAESLECCVPRCEEGDAGGGGVDGQPVSCVQGTLERSEVEGGGRVCDVGGRDEEGIDHLHHTAGE